MNTVRVSPARFAFIGLGFILQTIFICHTHAVLDHTNLAKFVQKWMNSEANNNENSSRELSREAIVSAFAGFLKIVDDPMSINRCAMNYNIPDVVRSQGFVEKLSISHLKNASLDEVYINDDGTFGRVQLTFPLLTISGWYNMTFHLDRHNISFYGNGTFVVQLNHLRIGSNVTLQKTEQGYTIPSKIAWNQTLSGVNFTINNVLDDDQVSSLFSENLSVVIPALHDSYKPLIDDFMGRAATFYSEMLFVNSKRRRWLALETIIQAFANANTKVQAEIHRS